MDLDMLIAASKDAIGAIIQKPKMTEKLLSKPPFRFLHDTISAVTATTGFGQGLYSETELDSAQITDKDAKISYLQKIFDLVGICKGAALKVSALKVVAGAEPENTNQFLIAFAEVATDSTIDNDEAVRRVLNGEEPGKRSIPYRRAAMSSPPAESKNDDVPISSGAKESRSSAKEIEPSMDINPDRGRSRGGTRGGKPQQASADTGLSRTTALPNLDKEIEKCDGTEVTTQTLLGELITRPKLTEKLLSKPPFRFLFDIVMEVTRSTGFAKYLYNEDEMNSANITEKSQKLNFLEKIIKVVGIQLNTIVVAQPAKIIAGQDAENTNIFLQQLAIAAKFAPESSNAVKTVIDELGGGSPQELVSAIANLNVNLNVNVAAATTASSATRKNDPTSARTEDRRALKQASSEPKDDVYVPTKDATAAADDKNGDNDGDGESKRSARPTTARRRPPKVKEGATEVSAKDSAPVSKKTEGILLDGQGDDDDEDMIADEKRLADDFKPDTRNGPSQTNAQSKLVKDILSLQAEQEAASRAANANDTADDKATEESKSGGIRLRGGLRKAGNDKKTFTGPLAGSGSSAGPSSSLAEGDIERIRSAVQVLVQHTGPLGSCMDYIQEDVGLMTAELHKWEDECRRDEALLATEKLKTKELLQPLQSELSELEDQIKDQVAKISSLKASITKNDDSIQKILKLVASS